MGELNHKKKKIRERGEGIKEAKGVITQTDEEREGS